MLRINRHADCRRMLSQRFVKRGQNINVQQFSSYPLAYILVLTAMVFSPVSYVAPAREISILIGTVMGAKLLSEGNYKARLLGACGMLMGLAALSLG